MPTQSREVRPCPKPNHVITLEGELLSVPEGWALLEPGDAALTRRIKQDGPTWVMKEKKGRRMFSRGVWAPAKRIAQLRQKLAVERSNPSYEKKLEANRARRAQKEENYREAFNAAIIEFLNFHPRFQMLARELANRITTHACPVGSGTVARTQRIPIRQRAEAATIAWMRHQTTAYDDMAIPRVKGKRREVRRILAQQSKAILAQYRTGQPSDIKACPLQAAIKKPAEV